MSKRKREEDTPGYESFPLIPSVTPSQDSQCENDAVHQIAERALFSARFGDMTLLCRDGGVLYAHKLIVCPQSEYFGRACSSRLKDATEPFQCLHTEPALMRKVLEYLYTGTYTIDFEHSTLYGLDAEEGPSERGPGNNFSAFCIANPAFFHVRMFAEADYFLIDGLKQTSKRLFRKSLASSIKKEATIHEAIEELYSNRCDYRELKEVAILALVKILRDPMIKNDSLVSSKIGQLIPDFALDLCTALMKVADQPLVVRRTPKNWAT